MKGGTVALLIGLPVVLGGGGLAAYFLLRKPRLTQTQGFGAMQAQYGTKAVSQMGAPGAGGGSSGGLLKGAVGGAGSVVSMVYGPAGAAAASVANKLIGPAASIAKKVPVLGSLGSKLHLW